MRNVSIAAAVLAAGCLAQTVNAQRPEDPAARRPPQRGPALPGRTNPFQLGRRPAEKPPAPVADPKVDRKVYPAQSVLPAPAADTETPQVDVQLPVEPVEPYLLTKEHGPFMVLAHTFKGENAERYALALVLELRHAHQLPAYVLRTKDIPARSNIRGVPPTAPDYIKQSNVGFPERNRNDDEAAVLVGNMQTLDDSRKLLAKVKKLQPSCLNNVPEIYFWRKGKGLGRATLTTNPYVPSEVLFPRKPDNLVVGMNQGPHSVYNCPGRFSLQVAEFTGRAALDSKDARFQALGSLHESPLKTAHEDAERLAEQILKDDEIRQTGYHPYVYHDRTSSKVFLGAFQAPNDPSAEKLRKSILNVPYQVNSKKRFDVVLIPSAQLTDVGVLKTR